VPLFQPLSPFPEAPPTAPVVVFHPFVDGAEASPEPLIGSSWGTVTFLGSNTAMRRKSPGMNLRLSRDFSSLCPGSVSSSNRDAALFSDPGSPRISLEYTMPMSFCTNRPLFPASA
jgi:hypothetical protein